MSKNTRYFIQPGNNFTDFSLDYAPEATLAGHTITVKGTSNVDYLFVAGAFHLDFSESLSGQDVVFVRGMRDDFTPSVLDGTLVLRIGNTTSLRLSEDDVVVFGDGKTVVTEWMAALKANTPSPALDASLKSGSTATEVAQGALPGFAPNALVRAFGGGDEGNTFAQVQPGMAMSVKGTTAVDVVYVKAGTSVDFSESLGGEDKLYLTGSFADYRFSVDGASLKLLRGETEVVLASTDDRLIFADGTVWVGDIANLLPTKPQPISADLGAKWRTSERTPGLNGDPNAPALPVVSGGALSGLENLDVRSNLVLTVKAGAVPWSLVAGQKIRIINDGPIAGIQGYQQEHRYNDIWIDVASGETTVMVQAETVVGGEPQRSGSPVAHTPSSLAASLSSGTSSVRLLGNQLIVDPCVDLDLANRYHITLDAGALVGPQGAGNAAITDPSAIAFQTVVPLAPPARVPAQAAVKITNEGTLLDSAYWVDLVGRDIRSLRDHPQDPAQWDPHAAEGILDASAHPYVFTLADVGEGVGLLSPALDVRIFQFGRDDRIYIDSQGNGDLPRADVSDPDSVGYDEVAWDARGQTDRPSLNNLRDGAVAMTYSSWVLAAAGDGGAARLELSLDPSVLGAQSASLLNLRDFMTKLNHGVAPSLAAGESWLNPNNPALFVVLG